MQNFPQQIRVDLANNLANGAQAFKTPAKAIPEFLENSCQYRNKGQNSVCIRIRRIVRNNEHYILVKDDARGMDNEDIGRFLTLSATNFDRQHNSVGRGIHGVGAKLAGFAMSERMIITSVKNGVQYKTIIDWPKQGEPVSDDPETIASPTTAPNGTLIEIGPLNPTFQKASDETYIKGILEKMKYLTNRHDIIWVSSNGDEIPIKYKEPSSTRSFDYSHPDFGNLTIKIASEPTNDFGIDITSCGSMMESSYRYGNSPFNRKMFGNFECPELQTPDENGIYAFTPERNVLNDACSKVKVLKSFLNDSLSKTIAELEKENKSRDVDIANKRRKNDDDLLSEIASKIYLDINARNDTPGLGDIVSGPGSEVVRIKYKTRGPLNGLPQSTPPHLPGGTDDPDGNKTRLIRGQRSGIKFQGMAFETLDVDAYYKQEDCTIYYDYNCQSLRSIGDWKCTDVLNMPIHRYAVADICIDAFTIQYLKKKFENADPVTIDINTPEKYFDLLSRELKQMRKLFKPVYDEIARAAGSFKYANETNS